MSLSIVLSYKKDAVPDKYKTHSDTARHKDNFTPPCNAAGIFLSPNDLVTCAAIVALDVPRASPLLLTLSAAWDMSGACV